MLTSQYAVWAKFAGLHFHVTPVNERASGSHTSWADPAR